MSGDSSRSLVVLHEGLVISTDGEQFLALWAEHHTHDMLGVASVASWLGTWTAWVVPQADEAVVITSGEESAIWGGVHTVDVGAVDT